MAILWFIVSRFHQRGSNAVSGESKKPTKSTSIKIGISDYQFDLSAEQRAFLDSFELVPGRQDGWYKDPSGDSALRYYFGGRWTTATVHTTSTNAEKTSALDTLFSLDRKLKTGHRQDSLNDASYDGAQSMSQSTEDRVVAIAKLLDSGLITKSEFDILKSEIFGR